MAERERSIGKNFTRSFPVSPEQSGQFPPPSSVAQAKYQPFTYEGMGTPIAQVREHVAYMPAPRAEAETAPYGYIFSRPQGRNDERVLLPRDEREASIQRKQLEHMLSHTTRSLEELAARARVPLETAQADVKALEENAVQNLYGETAKAKSPDGSTADLTDGEKLDALGDAMLGFRNRRIAPLEQALARIAEEGDPMHEAADIERELFGMQRHPTYTGYLKESEAVWERIREQTTALPVPEKMRPLLRSVESPAESTEERPLSEEEERLAKIAQAREIITSTILLNQRQQDILGQLLTVEEEGRRIKQADYDAMIDHLPEGRQTRYGLAREIGNIRNVLNKSGVGITVPGVVQPRRGYPHIRIDISDMRQPDADVTALGVATDTRNQIRFAKLRTADEMAKQRGELADLLLAGKSYDEIAKKWGMSRETVIHDLAIVQRDAVNKVLAEGAQALNKSVGDLSLDEQDTILTKAWTDFKDQVLKPLHRAADSSPKYSDERKEAAEKLRNMKRHPLFTGLHSSLRRIDSERDKLRMQAEAAGQEPGRGGPGTMRVTDSFSRGAEDYWKVETEAPNEELVFGGDPAPASAAVEVFGGSPNIVIDYGDGQTESFYPPAGSDLDDGHDSVHEL